MCTWGNGVGAEKNVLLSGHAAQNVLTLSINSLAVVSLAYYSARLAKSLWIGPAVFSEAVVRGPASLRRHPSLWVPPRRPRLTPKENTP